MNWLSLHIYYYFSLDALLTDCIGPIIVELENDKRIDQFFFIRYIEQGPHIRLRLKVQGNLELLEEHLDSKLREYFLKNPESFFLPENQVKGLFANETVVRKNYEPEFDRYGGINGVHFSEKHFEISSIVVLKILSNDRLSGNSRLLGRTIMLHLGLLFSFGFNLPDVKLLYESIYKNLSIFSEAANREFDSSRFEEKYQNQQKKISNFILEFWKALNESRFDFDWLEIWITKNKSLAHDISFLDIDPKPIYILNKPKHWALLEHYIHMTNNRLGINNNEERYIAYITNRALGDILYFEKNLSDIDTF